MTLACELYASIKARSSIAPDLGSASAEFSAGLALKLPNGVLANQADRAWSDTRSLAGSANESLDLAGVLTDVFGATLTFAKIRAILILAAAANAGDLVVGGAASNGFVGPFGASTHTMAVKPGGLLMVAAPATGWAVAAGTGDLLKIANSGGSTASYDIVLLGTSS